MHPGGLCKRFFHSTRSLFLPLSHQHPPTKAQRDNSKIPFLGEDPSVEGSKHKVTTCAWKKLFFCQVEWNAPPGTKVLSVYTEKHTMMEKWNRKKQSSFNGQQLTFTDILKCYWFTKMSMWINLPKKKKRNKWIKYTHRNRVAASTGFSLINAGYYMQKWILVNITFPS